MTDFETHPIGTANRIEELEAKLTRAKTGLVLAREELDAYSRHEYPGDHPVQQRYRQRDYDANPARIALAELEHANDRKD